MNVLPLANGLASVSFSYAVSAAVTSATAPGPSGNRMSEISSPLLRLRLRAGHGRMNPAQGESVPRPPSSANPSMSGSAVSLAKLIAEHKGMSELVEPEVPSRIELPATTVTKENVAAVQHLGY